MSDYSVTTDFSAKDDLDSGDPLKIIQGSTVDTEFDNISTAIATKYDSDDLATVAQAEAASSTSVLMSPKRVDNWAADNAGMIKDIQALTDPGADRILFWDDSANAAKGLTVGDGIEISATTLQLPAASAGNGLTLTSGVYAVVGGNGITANANDIAITDVAATTTNPVDISSGAVSLDVEALTTIEGNALAATDTFYVEDGGVSKGVEVQAMGLRMRSGVDAGTTSQDVEAADMNSIMLWTGTATLTLPLNSGTPLPIGVPIVLNMKHATQELTVTAASSVTLVSVNHPAGGSAASDTVLAGGTALLFKTAADVWCLTGDISD